jgi:hypothetical protein
MIYKPEKKMKEKEECTSCIFSKEGEAQIKIK